MVQRLRNGRSSFFITTWLVVSALVFGVLTAFPSQSFAKKNQKYASIVMDADTGMILHQRYADKKLHPASLTKVMTLLMLFEAMEQGKVTSNTRIRISSHAASMVPSKLGLKPGSSIKAKDAINALVTKSANDVAVAVAEHLGRSEKSFANLMTRKARHIGMRNTTFRNASGLHDSKQVSTARDMALLAQYVINHYPGYYKYYNRQSFTYQGKTYKNHNKLLGKYKGMDGMKTGYVRASGFNLIGSAVRNNRRIIGVVFGGRSGKTRNEHMANLLDRGFEKVNTIRVAHAQVPLPPRKPRMLLAMNEKASKPESYIRVQANQKIGTMGALIGEGDYDDARVKRIQTGMIAIAAHTGSTKAPQPKTKSPIMQHASVSPTHRLRSRNDNGWSVQLGAFGSRSATDDLLHKSLGRLPASSFGNVRTVIAPLKTQNGWLFRGRLGGMSKQQALAACAYFSECMPIAPGNQ